MQGTTYEMIAQATGASTATISRVRRNIERGEGTLELVLLRVGRGEPRRRSRHEWAAGGRLGS